jgi:saccharopine dehydrogenase (NADP+, L-glutamate forming)
MKHTLIIGAGRSASALIRYILEKGKSRNWQVVVADQDYSLALSRVEGVEFAKAAQLDVTKPLERGELIRAADVVASLLPAFLHIHVARDCIQYGKHLITASYNSPEMKALHEEAKDKGLIFMGEIGLDPGIDHMSAMKVIDDIRQRGGVIESFKSYAGGLVAPESDTNPWHYKFSWNPRNVILAGQGTAQYIDKGRLKYIPYHRLFERYETVDILNRGSYEMYPNRDSLLYRKSYDLEDIPTLIRGTLRHSGFCDAWNAFVKLGITDDTFPVVHSDRITYRQFITAFVDDDVNDSVEDKVAHLLGTSRDSEVMSRLEWTGIFENTPIGMEMATPAQILEQLLLKKWKLEPDDKDMIIMQHEFEYVMDGNRHHLVSAMTVKGENAEETAMSRLVGLPLGIFLKNVAEEKVDLTGVHIPVMEEVYDPVLEELADQGVVFEEKDVILTD